MEVILIEGVQYIKASQAAKKFKYTSDYIGQLCRGKKIDAKLIGRTWYVNPLSITSHKKEKFLKSSEIKKALTVNTDNELSRIDVLPVPRRSTAKILNKDVQFSHFAKHIDWKPIRYKEDDTELLPRLRPVSEQSAKIKVDIAESEKLVVRENSVSTTLLAEPLPEIALTGELKIQSLDEQFSDDDYNNHKNIDIPEVAEEKRVLGVRDFHNEKSNELANNEVNSGLAMSALSTKEIKDKDALYKVEINASVTHKQFTPELVASKRKVHFKAESEEVVVESRSIIKWSAFLILLSVFLAGLIFSFELDIDSTDTEYNWGIIFSFPDLKI
jgi:hypothetical protein